MITKVSWTGLTMDCPSILTRLTKWSPRTHPLHSSAKWAVRTWSKSSRIKIRKIRNKRKKNHTLNSNLLRALSMTHSIFPSPVTRAYSTPKATWQRRVARLESKYSKLWTKRPWRRQPLCVARKSLSTLANLKRPPSSPRAAALSSPTLVWVSSRSSSQRRSATSRSTAARSLRRTLRKRRARGCQASWWTLTTTIWWMTEKIRRIPILQRPRPVYLLPISTA